MKKESFEKTLKQLRPGASFEVSDVEGASRGIATCWNSSSFGGKLKFKNRNSLLVSMEDGDSSINWNMGNIYGPNSRLDRLDLWNTLEGVMENNKDELWMLGGDFNSPLYSAGKKRRFN